MTLPEPPIWVSVVKLTETVTAVAAATALERVIEAPVMAPTAVMAGRVLIAVRSISVPEGLRM